MIFKFGVLFLIAAELSVTIAVPACVCTREEKPVCGSDGITYSNMCMLNCAQATDPSIALQRVGSCEGTAPPNGDSPQGDVGDYKSCVCPLNLKPVCGSDGNTYNNACLLNCASGTNPELQKASDGPCDNSVKVVEQAENVSCACAKDYKPVCASNNVTFDNECLVRCSGTHLTVQYPGLCDSEIK